MLPGALFGFHVYLYRFWWCLGGAAAGSGCHDRGDSRDTSARHSKGNLPRAGAGQGRFGLGIRRNFFPEGVLRLPGEVVDGVLIPGSVPKTSRGGRSARFGGCGGVS